VAEDYILELFEEELAELEMQDDELLMVLEEPDQPKDSFVRLNYLLDSKIEFKLQEVNKQLGINILPNQLSTFKLLMCNFWNTERMIGISIGNNLTPPKALRNAKLGGARFCKTKMPCVQSSTFRALAGPLNDPVLRWT